MTIQASGAISFADLRTEYNTGSNTAISMADYYRGGSLVRSLAGNSNATNRSANVPTSGAFSLSSFYSQEKAFEKVFSANATDQNASTIFGSDYTVNYPKRIVVNSGVTVSGSTGTDALKYPSGATGTLTITNNGTISTIGAYAINNLSSTTVAVTNNGTVSGNTAEGFNSTFSGNGSAKMQFTGGFGGASGPDIYHSDYGSGFGCKLTRSGNTFTASWTYNECDYANLGAGSTNVSSIFPLTGSGELDTTNTSTYIINTSAGANGRDVRDLAFGSRVISGQRHFWFCSNNKSSSIDSGATTYSQPGWLSSSLTTSNSQRGNLLVTLTGGNTSGSVTGV